MSVDNQTKQGNEKSPERLSSSDKYLYLDNIINQYEIRHPKPSISRNTAKKMLLRDVRQLLAQAETRGRLEELKRLRLEYGRFSWGAYDPFKQIDDRLASLKERKEG